MFDVHSLFLQVCTNKKVCHCEGGFDSKDGCASGKRLKQVSNDKIGKFKWGFPLMINKV